MVTYQGGVGREGGGGVEVLILYLVLYCMWSLSMSLVFSSVEVILAKASHSPSYSGCSLP